MKLEEVLLKHCERYPKMQVQDMVKLIYQNEFGGGHLIKNKNESLKRLQEEYLSLGRYSSSYETKLELEKMFENIGNNLVRINLRTLKNSDSWNIDLAVINNFFVNTANSISGNIQKFEEKLQILKKCSEDKILPYGLSDIDTYLVEYKAKGYPAVSHSEIYRSYYFPAYRIIKTEYKDFFDVFLRIDSLLKSKDSVNVAIDGNSGSGKSTLASLIADIYDCKVFHMDDFFLTPELRTEERINEIGGNVDYIRFKNEIINGLHSGKEFKYRKFDCSKMSLKDAVIVTPKKLNIIEGSYSMHPALVENYDLKIFLYVDEEIQSKRILHRNGAKMHKMFINLWIPLENKYFNEMKIKENSDLVFNTL